MIAKSKVFAILQRELARISSSPTERFAMMAMLVRRMILANPARVPNQH
jgi:hypothetical protein